MKRIRGATLVTQQCLEDQRIPEFLGSIPKTIMIKELLWEGDSSGTWHRLHIPKNLEKEGMLYARESQIRTNIRGVFKNRKRDDMVNCIRKISMKYGVPVEKIVIVKVVVSDGKTVATFRRTRKQIKLQNDRRRKMMYLGLCNQNGKPLIGGNGKYGELLDDLHPKKVACQLMEEVKRVVVCSEVK